jgi:excisionase family DNA binding protein
MSVGSIQSVTRPGRAIEGADVLRRPSPPDAWLTADQVAAHLSLPRKRVYALVKAGVLPVSHGLGPRALRFSRQSIDAYMRLRVA